MKLTLQAAIYPSVLAIFKPEDLTPERLAPHINFINSRQTYKATGLVVLGEVEIDIELIPVDQIVAGAALALRMQAKEIRSKAGDEARALEAKAEQLLAIENKPTNLEKS